MLSYSFMVYALITGAFMAIVLALSGVWLNLRHLSMSGDAMSHASLAGIAIGLAAGINTTLMACLVAIIGGLCVELISHKIKKHQDMILAIVLSIALAIAGIAASYPEGRDLEGYLFGSILAITSLDMILTISLCLILVLVYSLKYDTLGLIIASPEAAKIQGIPVNFYEYGMTILSSLAIALASRIVGVLVVTSVLVLPIATAMLTSHSYKGLIIKSNIYALIGTIGGILCAWFIPWNPGSLIVLVSLVFFIIGYIINKCIYKRTSL